MCVCVLARIVYDNVSDEHDDDDDDDDDDDEGDDYDYDYECCGLGAQSPFERACPDHSPSPSAGDACHLHGRQKFCSLVGVRSQVHMESVDGSLGGPLPQRKQGQDADHLLTKR